MQDEDIKTLATPYLLWVRSGGTDVCASTWNSGWKKTGLYTEPKWIDRNCRWIASVERVVPIKYPAALKYVSMVHA